MDKTIQKEKDMRARIAIALYREYGRVPTEEEIDSMFHEARVLYRVVLGTHFMKRQQKREGQLVLF